MQALKESWLLKLYVQNIKNHYRIEVIDLLQHPALAREHEIVAVPTVVREAPVPIRKVVGDLSDHRARPVRAAVLGFSIRACRPLALSVCWLGS